MYRYNGLVQAGVAAEPSIDPVKVSVGERAVQLCSVRILIRRSSSRNDVLQNLASI